MKKVIDESMVQMIYAEAKKDNPEALDWNDLGDRTKEIFRQQVLEKALERLEPNISNDHNRGKVVSNNIKPCPFCGSEPDIERQDVPGRLFGAVKISCLDDACPAYVDTWWANETPEESALVHWNQRKLVEDVVIVKDAVIESVARTVYTEYQKINQDEPEWANLSEIDKDFLKKMVFRNI